MTLSSHFLEDLTRVSRLYHQSVRKAQCVCFVSFLFFFFAISSTNFKKALEFFWKKPMEKCVLLLVSFFIVQDCLRETMFKDISSFFCILFWFWFFVVFFFFLSWSTFRLIWTEGRWQRVIGKLAANGSNIRYRKRQCSSQMIHIHLLANDSPWAAITVTISPV